MCEASEREKDRKSLRGDHHKKYIENKKDIKMPCSAVTLSLATVSFRKELKLLFFCLVPSLRP